jgi:hypothetical protein
MLDSWRHFDVLVSLACFLPVEGALFLGRCHGAQNRSNLIPTFVQSFFFSELSAQDTITMDESFVLFKRTR